MSSTGISAFLDYNPPVVSTQCGEIYCSQAFDYFLINCSTCTQEFNLLSIGLFIKHIKECIPTILEKKCEVEEQIINLSSDEDEEKRIVQNDIQDNPEDEQIVRICEGIITQCETQSINNVEDYKLKVEEEQIVQQSCNNNYQNEAQSLTNSGDTLLASQQDFISRNNGATIDLADETIDLADYQDEDDLPLNKLPTRIILEMIIDEYKKHPVLWDITLRNKTNQRIRNHHLKQIWKVVNLNFNVNLTISGLRKHISRLRYKFERVLDKKKKFETRYPDGSKKFYPKLWYFEKFSFIKGTSKDCGIEPVSTNMSYASELSDEEVLDENGNSGSSKTESSKSLEKREMLDMIREYEKHKILWDKTEPLHHDRDSRNDALEQIANFINNKYNKNFTIEKMRMRITNIRHRYGRVKKNKEMKNVPINLWYYNQLSFIDRQCDDLNETKQNICLRKNNTRRNAIKNKNHILNIIELYKSAPILWNTNHPEYSRWAERRKVAENIIATLGEKHGCFMTVNQFYAEISLLKEKYFQSLRRIIIATQQNEKTNTLPRPFFFKEISFLEPFITCVEKPLPDTPVSDQINSCQNFSFLTENKPLLKAFIKLYKTQRCLWDPMDKNKKNAFVQSASYERFIQLFSENNITQTKEQVLSAIAFLHATVVNTQKTFEFGDPNTTNKTPVWFYKHLRFLGNISGLKNKYCNHCKKYFRSIKAYEKHKIEIAGDSPYKCASCNEGFKTRDLFTYHKKTHNEPKKCDQCDFRSYNKYNLIVHMRSHITTSQFPCKQCENGFFTSTELIRHVQKHTGNKIDGKTFYFSEGKQICNICGASFTRKEILVEHRLKHMCKRCGKLFPLKTELSLSSNNLIPRHKCDDPDLVFA